AGLISDRLIEHGGTAVLTETPEMFGAETILMNRCKSEKEFDKTVNMIKNFKRYFISHGQKIYENPSPGNRAGGITTLEEKSLGCVQKGGTSAIEDVLEYGGRVSAKGLILLDGPGNDIVSTSALTAAGCHLILFTTGRGTPLGAYAPTIKISSNSELASRKPNWTDYDAGCLISGKSMEEAGDELWELIKSVAEGKTRTKSEENGYREFAVFKNGVTL
ncbi:MAG: UxaA family hydrolase, partial [Oscillospiraceae bacterium]|nr:UxaA family hydrolase [Oscillospiraceae bacterium]